MTEVQHQIRRAAMTTQHTLPRPDELPTYHPETHELLAVIETPKGCRTQLRFDEEWRPSPVGRALPVGMSFPFDFGFIPRTKAEDGDPLDVLVLMDEPVPTGCAVEIRLIGVIEAEQKERDGEKVR